MKTQDVNNNYKNALCVLEHIAFSISERGYDDLPEQWDDYSCLLQTFEFKKLVTYELYEAYYLPRRHEHELEVLTQIVEAAASSKTATFLAGAAICGVVGNTAYDMLKVFLATVKQKFKKIRRTKNAIEEINENLQKIQVYMCTHNDVRISEIASELDIEIHKMEPLLKLLGCKSRYIKKHRIWRRPDTW